MKLPYTFDLWSALCAVNSRVNSAIKYKLDIDQFSKDEVWLIPEPDASGKITLPEFGDCDDYACCKLAILKHEYKLNDGAMGIAACTVKNEGHAVLIVATDKGNYVLDNTLNLPTLITDIVGREWVYIPSYLS
jgi:predicted transglutaminase-like cysteine proteinase